MIHCDLKLVNLFLNDDLEVKVGDFGIATRVEGERSFRVSGTPEYMAPEVLAQRGHSYEADIWGIGCDPSGQEPLEPCIPECHSL